MNGLLGRDRIAELRRAYEEGCAVDVSGEELLALLDAYEAQRPRPGQRYSDDRLSLANEIRNGLRVRGYHVTDATGGPDLIGDVFRALDQRNR